MTAKVLILVSVFVAFGLVTLYMFYIWKRSRRAAQSPPADGVWKNNLAPGEVSRREGSVSEVGESWDGLLDVNII